ncbi:hypothetical protein QYF61_008305 [Mycteria americana]|uniref:Uncharacterized protein n=1 Tax=Mycteria americana TaxID=33587 RepID=A0AAN7NBW8_MYCAM|nr:hypothetical protein QYF61_008305 [Mycteria americana]
MVSHCNRLLRDVVESPSLEIFKTQPVKVLGNLLLVLCLLSPTQAEVAAQGTRRQSLPTLKQNNTPAQLGVVCKLTEGALDPLVQIIDKDIKQNWPQS